MFVHTTGPPFPAPTTSRAPHSVHAMFAATTTTTLSARSSAFSNNTVSAKVRTPRSMKPIATVDERTNDARG